MWCRNCQQDVPAVAKSVDGPLVCTRCEGMFDLVHPSDTGVSLDSLINVYLADIPFDPIAEESGTGTDYLISADSADGLWIWGSWAAYCRSSLDVPDSHGCFST